MSGNEMLTPVPLIDKPIEKRHREASIREITLARALYRCEDHERVGETILKAYSQDIRSIFAKHAKLVSCRNRIDRSAETGQ